MKALSQGPKGNRNENSGLANRRVVVGSVGEEYAWVQRNCPGFKLEMQSLRQIDNKPYDVLQLSNEQGEKQTVYFDISSFYGKF